MKAAAALTGMFVALLGAVIAVIMLVRVPDMFEVRGEAEIPYTPDQAEITASIYAEADVSLDAVKEAAATMRLILAALKEAGVADKDIKTADVRSGLLDDSSERNRAPDAKRSYYAEQAVVLTVRDVAHVGKTLDAIARAGSNYWKVRYHVNETRAKELEAEARRQALLNAIATADTYARDGKFTRGRVLKIQDEEVSFPEVDYPERTYRTRRSVVRREGVERVTVTGTRTQIPDTTFDIPPPREQAATATTHVLFEID